MKHEMAILLHNVRSAHNVGSIFRTADAAGVSRMFLSGYTPLPVDRFARAQKEIAKIALGAEQHVEWLHVHGLHRSINRMKLEGWQIVGVEQSKQSVDYKKFKPKKKTLLIFGNEVRGISSALLKKCDVIVEIPMHGKKESLNVAVTAGIILFSAQH
jgi:23S rRNA (guanosine2251-2'-O)-methyltransferase